MSFLGRIPWRRRSLADLARMYGTDKLAHGYLPHYERHLGPLRKRRLRVLEIGIHEGASLRMWHAYLSRSLVCGIDVKDRRSLARPRIKIYQGDQTDPDLLRRVVAETGGLDVVIDDGSHVNQQVLATFGTLFPLLNEGGLYVIEDIHTSYWSPYGGEHQDLNSGRTTASFVKGLIDGLNCHWIPGRDPDERDRTIDAVHCYPKVVFISKGTNKPVHRPHELKMMQASVSDRQPPSPGQPTGHGATDPGATPPGPIPTPHDRGERGGEGSGPPLLIAAIYAPSALNARWYALQRRFIAKTTTVGYDFKVFLNGVDPAGFEATEIMAALKGNEGHSHALGHVLAHFKEHPYQAYLILDSDCFPVRKGWHDVLANQMHRFNKDFAAPVRAENLDLFPHPSAVFMRRNALDDGRLDFTRSPRRNLLGEEVQDVGSAMQDLGGALLPLLRTNVVNVHPVAAAIYHHLFYHHGAGSRDFGFRILRRFRYYEHWYDPRTEPSHGDELLEALLRDPDAFVDTLMGGREPLIRGHLLWPGPRE